MRQATAVGAEGLIGAAPSGLAPVVERDRIFTLDALRGVAIFGVLAANVLTFAFPAWSGPPPGEGSGGEVSRLVVGFLVEGKFYVLFALLFGMGLALQPLGRGQREAR